MAMPADELIMLHTRAYKDGALPIYVVTQNPKDYPGKFVVRAQYATRAADGQPVVGPIIAVEDTLSAARKALDPIPVVRMDRHPQDDAVIVETWL